jgi:DNA-directed RNA polymerase subunit beta
VEECQQRDMTYAAPLKVTLRLIVFDVDETTGARSVKDIKEQDVYMGDMPADDAQRHVHRERHRARDRQPDAPLAGRVLRPRQGQDPFLGQASVRCRIIPYRGSWLDFEFDAKDMVTSASTAAASCR